MALDRAGGNTPGKHAVAAPVGLEGVSPVISCIIDGQVVTGWDGA